MMSQKQIAKAIKAFVKENYGEDEANHPSWDIKALAAHLEGIAAPLRNDAVGLLREHVSAHKPSPERNMRTITLFNQMGVTSHA